MRRGLQALLALLALASCGTENAILELEVQLPADDGTGDAVYAVLTMRSASEPDFDVPLSAGQLEGFLLGAEPRTEVISVVAQPEDFDQDLLVRARFCSTAGCDGLGDDTAGERRLVVEHPFYALRVTEATWTIDAVEAMVVEAPDVVDRCDVRGCRDGNPVQYCNLDGTHFCE